MDIIIKMRQSCISWLGIVRSQIHSGYSNSRFLGEIEFFTGHVGNASNLDSRYICPARVVTKIG